MADTGLLPPRYIDGENSDESDLESLKFSRLPKTR